MTRRGFALLTVLWVIAGLAVVGGTAAVLARTGAATSRNRVLLARAGWARNACEEIALARYAEHHRVQGLDSIDLGRDAWCRVTLEDAGSRLGLNQASPETLRLLLGSDSLADALADWRDADTLARPHGAEAGWYREHGRREPRDGPLADVAELRLVRGFDSLTVARLARLLTTRNPGPIDLNSAPGDLLGTLPGLDAAAVAIVISHRAVGKPLGSADELLGLLPASSRQTLLARYQDFTGAATFAPRFVLLRVEGFAGTPAILSAARVTVAPVPDRLAVIRREVL